MRVTIVLPCLDLSGGNRIVSVYASMLAAAGHQVVVVVAGPRRETLRERIRRARKYLRGERPPPPLPGPRSHFDGLPLDVRHLDSYRPLTPRDVPDADVIVATWWETAEWVAALPPAKGAQVYLVQHHETFEYQPVDRVRATYRLPLHKIAVAPWLADLMRSEYGDDRVDVVLNATDPSQFWAPERGKQAQPTMGFMYASTAFKAVDVAIEAVHRVADAVPGLQVVSFGREQPAGLAFLGDRLRYTLAPTQEQIRTAYASCDVWLMSSRSEGFGLPALEAMACRTPLVSTRMGWPASAVEDGRNGYLADVNDAPGLARGLIAVLQAPPTEWAALSAAAAASVADLTWERTFPQFVAALERARRRQPATEAVALA